MMPDYITTWYGDPVSGLSRDKLLEIIEFMSSELQELQSPKAIHARALGRAEILKGR